MNKKYNTLKYYNDNAEEYFKKTVNGKLIENYNIFLNYIPKNSYLLDFGCGFGRDSKVFIDKGYRVRAIDGSIKMCEIGTKYLNQNVDCIQFKDFDEENVYDAIWACASILHVEEEDLPDILLRMIKAIKNNGVMYISFKKGNGTKIVNGRFFNYMTKEKFENILSNMSLNYEILEYFETISNKNLPEECIWVNFVIKFNKS